MGHIMTVVCRALRASPPRMFLYRAENYRAQSSISILRSLNDNKIKNSRHLDAAHQFGESAYIIFF